MTNTTIPVSKVIRSIKTDYTSWVLFGQTDSKLIMTNNKGYYFIRYSRFKGFKLYSPDAKVEMFYAEEDPIAQQLWGYLVNSLLGV